MASLPLPMVKKFLLPENGIVQPLIKPPEYRIGRRTNQLEYFGEVINEVWQNYFSNYFRHPVNAIECNLPNYHNVIQFPMDLKTIRLRLENKYYWCVNEAIKDVNLMLDNCFKFYAPLDRVYILGIKVRDFFNSKMELMPTPEIDLEKDKADNTGQEKKRSRKIQAVNLIGDEEHESTAPQLMDQQTVELPIENSELPEQMDVSLGSCITDKMQIKNDNQSLAIDSKEISSNRDSEQALVCFSDPNFRDDILNLPSNVISLRDDVFSLGYSLQEFVEVNEDEVGEGAETEGYGTGSDEEDTYEGDAETYDAKADEEEETDAYESDVNNSESD